MSVGRGPASVSDDNDDQLIDVDDQQLQRGLERLQRFAGLTVTGIGSTNTQLSDSTVLHTYLHTYLFAFLQRDAL